MDEILSCINPELLVLIPVLYLIGMGLKRSERDDRLIPLCLGAFGIVMACIYGLATMQSSDSVAMVVFTGIIQGVLCAAAAVYVNQNYKQIFVKGE